MSITDIQTRDLLTATDSEPDAWNIHCTGVADFIEPLTTARGEKYVIMVLGFKISMAYFSPVRQVVL